MTRHSVVPLVVLAQLLFVSSIGCKKTTGGGSSFSIPRPGGGPANPLGLSGEDVALRDKLQPVIHCINSTFGYYEQFGPVYHKHLAKLMTPPPTPKPGAFPVQIPDLDMFTFTKFYQYDRSVQPTLDCAAGLEKSAAASPAIPDLDAPARDEAAALRAMVDPGQQMDSYLDQKGYLDDHFAKARSLDQVLSPLLARMDADSAKLRTVVRREETTLKQRELAAIDKREGHSLHWHTEETMIAARNLNDQLVGDFRAGKLTAESAQAAIQPLQSAFDDGEAYARAHPNERKANGNGLEPAWFSLVSDFTGELAAAKELRQDLQTYPNANDTPQERREHFRRQIDSVNSQFNYAVDAYNRDVQDRQLMPSRSN